MVPYTAVNITGKEQQEMLQAAYSLKMGLRPRGMTNETIKPVVLFGAGNLGRLAADFFRYVGVTVSTVVVNQNVSEQDVLVWREQEMTILTSAEVPERMKRDSLVLICIATAPIVPIINRLQEEGWEDIMPFYDFSQSFAERGEHPLNNGWFLGELDDKEKELIASTFDSWSDDASRAHYLQFLAWRAGRVEFTQDTWAVEPANRFFIPEVVDKLGEAEIFLDCGAHVGSVIETFRKVTAGKYASIHAFEPDSVNYQKLEKAVSSLDKITHTRIALSDKEGPHCFAEGFDYASRLVENGRTMVESRRLDSLDLAPTFIKIHTEGSELAIVKGALKTIQKSRPILALTVYHNDHGVWRTPMLLMQQLVGYRFLFRAHSYAGTGAVIYAIPLER